MSDFDRNRLASLFREFLEEGADEKALRLFLPVLVDEPASKSPKTHAPKTEIQQRAAEIAKETWQVASTGEVLPGYYDSARGEFKPVPQPYPAMKLPLARLLVPCIDRGQLPKQQQRVIRVKPPRLTSSCF